MKELIYAVLTFFVAGFVALLCFQVFMIALTLLVTITSYLHQKYFTTFL